MKEDSHAYLTFILGQEKFAIPVDYVHEVVEIGNVTRVPKAPEYMLGIINLRGRILPLLDTRLKLGLEKTQLTKKSRILVLDINDEKNKNINVGAMVDVATEVIEIQPSEIQDAPEFESLKTSAPITGLMNKQGDITMIMDIQKVFSLQELQEINQTLN